MTDIYSVSSVAEPSVQVPWLMEFTQGYDDGLTVDKKGVDATPMVVRKYGIGDREVMAFSSHQGRRRALTVFHFHPGFPAELRHGYMEAHEEGRALAAEVTGHAAALRRERFAEWRAAAGKLALAAAGVAPAGALYVIAHWPDSR